jgi:hypothetical protein
MNEPFIIAINDQEYKARFERYGYTHRIAVLIGEETVIFEPDEEGNYRALSNSTAISLLQAIAEKLRLLQD